MIAHTSDNDVSKANSVRARDGAERRNRHRDRELTRIRSLLKDVGPAGRPANFVRFAFDDRTRRPIATGKTLGSSSSHLRFPMYAPYDRAQSVESPRTALIGQLARYSPATIKNSRRHHRLWLESEFLGAR